MAYQSIEEHLEAKFGFDQYQVWDHARKHRQEIERSSSCACFFCYARFLPEDIQKWVDEGLTACCPSCGLSNSVIGSASEIPLENELLELVHAHWF